MELVVNQEELVKPTNYDESRPPQCPSCFDSGFVHVTVKGVLGVAAYREGELVRCDCRLGMAKLERRRKDLNIHR